MKFIMHISYKENIPVFAFSDKYVKNSALIALSVDVADIGSQAGDIANKIFSGMKVDDIKVEKARKGVFTLNLKTASKMRIQISETVIKEADIIYE